jgi:hypothetical protein
VLAKFLDRLVAYVQPRLRPPFLIGFAVLIACGLMLGRRGVGVPETAERAIDPHIRMLVLHSEESTSFTTGFRDM